MAAIRSCYYNSRISYGRVEAKQFLKNLRLAEEGAPVALRNNWASFGRTVHQNGNSGTDHGRGTYFLAQGGDVQGGKVLGQWPGLTPEQLYENRD